MALIADTELEVGDPAASRSEPSHQSQYAIAWRRFRRDRVGLVSLGVIVLVVVIAAAAPLIVRLLGLEPDQFHSGLIGDGALPKHGPWRSGISADHPLGIEPSTGRDILARLLYGARVSLLITVLGTAATLVIGVTIGLVAGYAGGWVDATMGRLMDLILSVPQLILLVTLSPVVIQLLGDKFGIEGNTARIIFIISMFGVLGWPYIARIVRGQVLSFREREFIDASRASGSSAWRILHHDLLPNLWVPIIVYGTLLLPTYIAAEAALSFLGVGVTEPTPTWGKMLADSVTYYQVDPLYLFIPGGVLFVVVLAFNLFGDSVRDALDPRGNRA
jgi:peptide/nickel transport system permease protein